MAYAHGINADGELLSSAYVHKDRDNPDFNLDCSDLPSLTRQEFADDCDINNLMAQYEKTGVINHFNNGEPRYYDFEEMPDLQNSLHILKDATTAFMSLPAHVRKEFDNDPTQFIEFASDPKNLDKMREYGLAAPAPVETPPQKVEITNLDGLEKKPLDPVTK
ncbi:internal scaffolding protein [Blackfly microvirus SF02]|uniref:Internal scaffolding protein n=1 Tax=Blackfly microvirus SF02 TaxID=2576452 RepID=A0A4P8PTD3_9VIRU|nr:internal scaffolding protein [Blackfly microvirus SF02]